MSIPRESMETEPQTIIKQASNRQYLSISLGRNLYNVVDADGKILTMLELQDDGGNYVSIFFFANNLEIRAAINRSTI